MKTLARIGFLRENSRGMGAKCPKEKCRCNSSVGHLVKFNQGSGGIQRFSVKSQVPLLPAIILVLSFVWMKAKVFDGIGSEG